MAELQNLRHFSVIYSEVTSGWQDILEDVYAFKHTYPQKSHRQK